MSNEHLADVPNSDFELDKRRYFINLAWQMRQGLAVHQNQGLWERVPVDRDVPQGETKRDWGNVSEHCLVEGARVGVFADILGFTPDLKHDLMLAAVLHDGGKKNEIQKLRANGTSWEAYAEAGEDYKNVLTEAGFSARVIRLATAIGHETLEDAQTILDKSELGQEDQAWLVMHYVDDYTREADWASPAATEDGRMVGDLGRRMAQNLKNAQPGGKYEGINNAGVAHFGVPTYVEQGRVGSLVETRLAGLVSTATGTEVPPYNLPVFIDQRIRAQIEAN